MIAQFDYGISPPVLTSHPRPLNLQLLEANFNINVNIVGGQDVRGYKITVEYDNNSLRYVSHTHGDYLSDKGYRGPIVSKLGQVSFSNVSTATAGSGDGTLATITF